MTGQFLNKISIGKYKKNYIYYLNILTINILKKYEKSVVKVK